MVFSYQSNRNPVGPHHYKDLLAKTTNPRFRQNRNTTATSQGGNDSFKYAHNSGSIQTNTDQGIELKKVTQIPLGQTYIGTSKHKHQTEILGKIV